MAFNNANSNNSSNNNDNSIQSYSIYGVSNVECKDPTKLGYSYWNGNLCIAISTKSQSSNSNNIEWDYQNSGKIYLTHHNARMFAYSVRAMLADPKKFTNVGVTTRSGSLITFAKGSEIGESADDYCLIIRKVNENTGKPESTHTYLFKNNYSSIINYDPNTSGFDKYHIDNIEITEMLDLIDSYCMAMTGAVAYSVRDEMKWSIDPVNNKINAICKNLGIEVGNGRSNYNGGGNRNSYFNNNNSSSNNSSSNRNTTYTSMSDLDDGID